MRIPFRIHTEVMGANLYARMVRRLILPFWLGMVPQPNARQEQPSSMLGRRSVRWSDANYKRTRSQLSIPFT